VRCHSFVTESTFALPIYRWRPQADIFDEINGWWRANQLAGKASMLFAYALGKAQRLLAGVDPAIGPIFTHGAVERLNEDYRASGVALPATTYAAQRRGVDWSQALIIAPPSAQGSPWMRRFGAVSTAFASGWMQLRGTRRRKAVDRGFALSDHADWPGLLDAIAATGAERVWTTHGYSAALARWLREGGLDATAIAAHFEGGQGEASDSDLLI
jgi:putative mRNA 3-end processing factor